jgi:hypothetical protein
MSKPNTELIHLPYPIYRQCGSVTCPSDKNLKFSLTHYTYYNKRRFSERRYIRYIYEKLIDKNFIL